MSSLFEKELLEATPLPIDLIRFIVTAYLTDSEETVRKNYKRILRFIRDEYLPNKKCNWCFKFTISDDNKCIRCKGRYYNFQSPLDRSWLRLMDLCIRPKKIT